MQLRLGKTICFLLLLASSALARRTLAETLDRAHRVTQEASFTVGGKTYSRSAAVAKYCTDNGVQPSDLNPNKDEFNQQMEKMTNKYAGPRPQIEPILKSGGSSTSFDAGAAINTVIVQIGFPALISVLSLLSAWFLFWWSLLECCCKKTCCMKEIKEGDPMSCGQKCIGVSNVIVGLGLLIILIIWSAQAGGAARGFKYLTCEMASLSSDIVQGVEYKGETNLKFIGLDGLSDMLKGMSDAINTFKNKPLTKPTTIDSNQSNLKSKFNDFYTKWNTDASKTTLRLSLADSGTLPDSIKAFDGLVNQALRTEIDTLTKYGQQMIDAFATVNDIKTQSGSTSSAIDSMRTTLDNVRKPMKTVGEDGIKALGIETFQTLIVTALTVALIIVIGFLVLFYFIAFMNIIKNKLHCLKFINKIIMILKILLSIFLNMAAALFVIVSVVFSNMCYFLWKASSDSDYTSSLSDDTIKKMMRECVIAGGSGDMTKLMGGSNPTDQIKKFTDMSNTINSVFDDSLLSNFTAGTVEPQVGVKTLKKNWQDTYTGSYDDFKSLTGGGFNPLATDFKNFNDKMSANGHSNRMALTGGCTSGTLSQTTPDVLDFMDQLANSYCLQLGNFPGNNALAASAVANADDRYDGLTDAAILQSLYDKPIATWSTFRTRVDTANAGSSFAADYGFAAQAALTTTVSGYELEYMKDLQNAYNQFKALRTDLSGLLGFVQAFSNNLLNTLNCNIIGIHVKQLQVAMCLKVGDSFVNQTTSLGALGFFIFLFPWCICCGIRCAPKKPAGDNKNQTAPASDSQALPPQEVAPPVGFQPQAQGNAYGGPQNIAQPAKGYL